MAPPLVVLVSLTLMEDDVDILFYFLICTEEGKIEGLEGDG